MNLQQFEKLLCEHIPPRRAGKIIRVYLDVAATLAGAEVSPVTKCRKE